MFELKQLQKKKEGVILEHQARLAKLNAEKESIDRLRLMKKNEEKQLEELMKKRQEIAAAISAETSQMEQERSRSERQEMLR